MTRGGKTVRILAIVAVLTVSAAFAAYAMELHRMVLWQVVRACVADYKLTGTPFPCLEVNLTGGEQRGAVVLRPPFLDDTVLSPTRRIKGVEDPFLQLARGAELFRRCMARAHVPQGGGRTRAGARRDCALRELRHCQDSGPAPHPRGLPCPLCPPHARSGCAQDPDGRMGADRPGRSPYDVLGLPHPGDGPCERQSVSIGRRGAGRQSRMAPAT